MVKSLLFFSKQKREYILKKEAISYCRNMRKCQDKKKFHAKVHPKSSKMLYVTFLP